MKDTCAAHLPDVISFLHACKECTTTLTSLYPATAAPFVSSLKDSARLTYFISILPPNSAPLNSKGSNFNSSFVFPSMTAEAYLIDNSVDACRLTCKHSSLRSSPQESWPQHVR